MKVWRICREQYVSSALSGVGSQYAPGRWNSLGVPMVYASTSLALAALEVFVHVRTQEEPLDLVSLCADVPLQLEAFEEGKKQITKELPERWRFEDVRGTRHLGDAWTASQVSVVLVIPSVVIDGEWNVLLNPEHRDAAKLKVLDVRPFRFDARMFNVR
jgi:RES domain-containing protein